MGFQPWLAISLTWGESWQMLTAGSRSQRLRCDLSGLRPRRQGCLKRSLGSCIVQLGLWAPVLQCKRLCLFLYYSTLEKKLLPLKNDNCTFLSSLVWARYWNRIQMLTKFSSCGNPVFLNWPEMMIIKTVMRKLILMILPDRHHK